MKWETLTVPRRDEEPAQNLDRDSPIAPLLQKHFPPHKGTTTTARRRTAAMFCIDFWDELRTPGVGSDSGDAVTEGY